MGPTNMLRCTNPVCFLLGIATSFGMFGGKRTSISVLKESYGSCKVKCCCISSYSGILKGFFFTLEGTCTGTWIPACPSHPTVDVSDFTTVTFFAHIQRVVANR